MIKYYGLLGIAALLGGGPATAQNVGMGTTQPNGRAILDISSPTGNQGLLIPRLDSVQRVGIASPPDGLMVFQKNGRQGLWYAFGGQWLYLPPAGKRPDDLGAHSAAKDLNLGTNKLVGNGGTAGVGVSSKGGVDIGSSTGNLILGSGGEALTTGGTNGLVGADAGWRLTTGSSNEFWGNNSSYAIQTSGSNAFIGDNAGTMVLGGISDVGGSVAIGSFSRFEVQPTPQVPSPRNMIAVGYTSIGVVPNTLVLGNYYPGSALDNVGIGTASPQRALDVNGTIRQTTYTAGSFTLRPGEAISYDWNHGLGYRPMVIVSRDQTGGGGAEYVRVSYEHADDNLLRFWLRNGSDNSTATFVLRWIRVD
ncbi:hypothetical protein [Hymenobacter chitinivorans]|uniref:HAF family extracellular repeat protein n=1 Tax=Hymenobacter chitinivorans DSM 11115 TaxID=1121954 RepID=A0A2M9ASS9_9BACT|nr:hypothetical protein [Hymenobacter chitinivorans]PJJ48742.1 hypothetical protein CLV45_4452 [Hymenobacter chitinivorans DSM 11115]